MKIEDALGALRNLIVTKFKEATGSDDSQALLAFEFGTPFPDDDFRLTSDAVDYSPATAVEVLSRHAQSVAHVEDSLYVSGALTIANQYEILLRGAAPAAAGVVDLLGAIKSTASAAFEETLGSLQGEFRFHPTFATPVNWYEANSLEGWTHIQISQSDQPPPPPAPQPGINSKLFSWRLAPIAVQPMLGRALTLNTVREISAASPVLVAPALSPAAPHTMVLLHPAIAVPAAAAVTGSLSHARAFNLAGPTHNDPGLAIPAHFVHRFANRSAISMVQLAAATASSGDQKPVAADGFSIDVEMSMVRLTRPWLSDALLTLPNWYVPGFARGSFSAGTGSGDEGTLPLLPTACIFIRNLKIHAQWSDADRQVIQSSGGLGTFSLIGRQFDSNSATLTVPGMQSIAWMYEVLPVLPPSDAPQT